jgi:hypothetical protein
MLSGKAIRISHLPQIDRSREGQNYFEKWHIFRDGNMAVRFVKNAIITHICIAKGVRRLRKEFISDVNVLE